MQQRYPPASTTTQSITYSDQVPPAAAVFMYAHVSPVALVPNMQSAPANSDYSVVSVHCDPHHKCPRSQQTSTRSNGPRTHCNRLQMRPAVEATVKDLSTDLLARVSDELFHAAGGRISPGVFSVLRFMCSELARELQAAGAAVVSQLQQALLAATHSHWADGVNIMLGVVRGLDGLCSFVWLGLVAEGVGAGSGGGMAVSWSCFGSVLGSGRLIMPPICGQWLPCIHPHKHPERSSGLPIACTSVQVRKHVTSRTWLRKPEKARGQEVLKVIESKVMRFEIEEKRLLWAQGLCHCALWHVYVDLQEVFDPRTLALGGEYRVAEFVSCWGWFVWGLVAIAYGCMAWLHSWDQSVEAEWVMVWGWIVHVCGTCACCGQHF